MEKLIELLNEYEKGVKKSEKVWSIDNDGDICRQTYEGVDYNGYTEYMNTNNLISKSFGFIKWLVENDKINFKTFDNDSGTKYLEYPIGSDNYDQVYDYKDIIKWLAISDTPIEDLIYYLK